MNKKVHIFETSKAAHETSIIVIAKIFQRLGYDLFLWIGRYPEERMKKSNRNYVAKSIFRVTNITGVITFLKS